MFLSTTWCRYSPNRYKVLFVRAMRFPLIVMTMPPVTIDNWNSVRDGMVVTVSSGCRY